MKMPSFFKPKTAAKPSERDAAKASAALEPKKPAIDFKQIVEDFKTLNPQDPGLWPAAPRFASLFGLFTALLVSAWYFGWNVQMEELDGKVAEEVKLKDDWIGKKKQAVNLDEHRRQLEQINNTFGALLKQLPNRSEMGDLLVDINKAAQSRGLLVDLFKPGVEAPRDFFAELPITLQLTGSYHDIGTFAGDIAELPRIVTLNDIDISTNPKDALLVMRTTAKTFRYLDEEELARVRAAQKAKGAKK
jgi:type IV pilus assembly protein PilO